MTNTTITNFRENIFEYVNQALRYNDLANVATKNGNAVRISEEEYNGILKTWRLMSIPGIVESIAEAVRWQAEKGAVYSPDEEWLARAR